MKVTANSDSGHSTARADEASTANLLCEVAQLLETVRQSWRQEGHWSEWDQSVVERFRSYRKSAAEAQKQDVHASAAPAAAPLPVPAELAFKPDWMDFQHGYEAGLAAAPLPQDERERHTIALVEIAAIHLGNAQARGDREQMKFWRGVLTQHKSRAALSAASPAAPIRPMNTDDGHSVSSPRPGSYDACPAHGLAHPCEMCVYEQDVAPLENALAECRDLFPVPEPGAPAENEWLQAVGDPLSVPAFIRATLNATSRRSADTGQARVKCTDSGCSDSIGIAAPAAAVQPMTDDEIAGLWKKWVGTPRPNYSFARAIEGAVKASIGTPAATVQPVAQIQNLAAHGLMYLRERQHGFAEQAFNDILDITSAAVQSDTEREKRRAAVSRLLADKGIYMSNEFVFSLIDAAMGTQPAGKEQP